MPSLPVKIKILLILAKDFRTTAPEENCPPDNWSPRQLPARIIAPEENCPQTIALEDNCAQGKVAPRRIVPHHKISPENNCPNSSKFPSTRTKGELRKTMVCLRVL